MKQLYFLLLAAVCSPFFLISQSWELHDSGIPPPTLGCASVDVVDSNTIWAVFTHITVTDSAYGGAVDSTSIVTVSTDGGNTWTSHQAPMGNPPLVANITAVNGQVAWLSGLDFGGGGSRILKTIDGGANWTEQTSANWDAALSWVDFTYFWNDAKGVSMGDPTGGEFEIYTTGNGGQAWIRVDGANIDDPQPGEFGFNGGYDVVNNTVWFGTSTGRVYRSKDSGLSWKAFNTGLPYVWSVSFRDENIGFISRAEFVGFQSEVQMTTNGGETWNDIAKLPENGNVRIEYGLENIPGTSTLLLATSQESLIDGIYKTWLSYDDGSNWIQIDSGNHVAWLDFKSQSIGWAGQPQKPSGASYLFEFAGITGLFDPKPLQAEVNVFPNPTSGMFRMDVHSPQITDFLILVNDVQGRLVLREMVVGTADFQRYVDLSGQAAGVYSVTVSNVEGSFSTKILKQ